MKQLNLKQQVTAVGQKDLISMGEGIDPSERLISPYPVKHPPGPLVCQGVKPTIDLVWFKRDLRLEDHGPLAAAARSPRPVLLCYALEPLLTDSAESDDRHWRFAYQGFQELRVRLESQGHQLYLFHRNFDEVLRDLLQAYQIEELLSHQETGLQASFARDRHVKALCQQHGIRWREWQQDGVFRGLASRDGWWARWEADMQAPLQRVDLSALQTLTLPAELVGHWVGGPLPGAWQQPAKGFQPGGSSYGWRYLQSFISERAEQYTRQLSKPAGSRLHSSRLSPYLAHGHLSVRQVYQAARDAAARYPWAREFERWHDRLWWRSHYMQKLETEYQIEWRPINHGLQSLERPLQEDVLLRFEQGQTGYPLVDACMRCLKQNGYLNFRMRAMLATFATFALWQPMTAVAQVLARLFLDYEPGLHYGQMQMQSGLSGYHPLRLFNPIIQAERHDPQGDFIRQYIPELKDVPAPQVFAPWRLSALEQGLYHCQLGHDYPHPIVDYDTATQAAKDRYWAHRQSPAAQAYLPTLWQRHCLPGDKERYQALR